MVSLEFLKICLYIYNKFWFSLLFFIEIKRQTDIIKRYLDKFLEHTKVITDQKIIPIKTNIIPKQPFSTIEEFLKFENIIKNDEEKYNQLVSLI